MAENEIVALPREEEVNEAILADRFVIHLGQPLERFHTAGATAYAARDLLDGGKVYALVQRLAVPRREHVASRLLGRNIPSLACIRGEGVLPLMEGEDLTERMVTIVEAPAGGPVVEDPARFTAYPERVIKELFAPQLADALAALDGLGITHRAISLRNLYWRDKARTQIMLGECFSAPPGYHQPPAYEPIERAFADPCGRGTGDFACDMYALGVTLMSLFLGRDAGINRQSETAELEARIRVGSYWALGGSNELAGTVSDLLRGLMEDNPSKRWVVEDVKRWCDGLIGRKTVSDPGWVLTRPAIFRDRSHKDRRHLALALLESPRAAVIFARSDRFRHWIEGALAEGPTSDWISRALDDTLFRADGDLTLVQEHMAIARLMAVFFPEGPICFGPLRICGDGFAGAFAMLNADNDQERLGLLRELFARSRLAMLLDLLSGRCPALRTALAKLLGAIPWTTTSGLGNGFERCLYEFNKGMPCLSPRLRGTYVDSPKALVEALEAAAARGEVGAGVIDPHIAAFLLHHSAAFEGPLARLTSASLKPENYLVETVRLLGLMQQKFYRKPLNNIAAAMLPALRKHIDGLKSASRRKRVHAALDQLATAGDLTRLATDLNLIAVRQRDSREFDAVQRQYAGILAELRRLSQPVSVSDPRVRADGHRLMAYLAYAALAGVSVLSFVQAFG